MLNELKKEANKTLTENGAVTYCTTQSDCLDLFAVIGALRRESEQEIVERFARAYAEDPGLAMKILFYARDVRGGLGERRVFRTCLRWLAEYAPESVRKNLARIAEYGRWDDLFVLEGTLCESSMMYLIRRTMHSDLAALEANGNISLLGKWMPSVNASCAETVRRAKRFARRMGMTEPEYRRALVKLRERIRIIENNLREKDYSFDYAAQPSKALFKYRAAFNRNDAERYQAYLGRVSRGEEKMHTGTLAPYEIIEPILKNRNLSETECASLDVTWNAQEDFAGDENALVIVDGSGSMYWSNNPSPASVALSLGVYFAERNKGAFANHFITFSHKPRLIEVKGSNIVEKIRYCMTYQDCSNTDIQKVFELILSAAVNNQVPQEKMPSVLYFITDMEFDCCSSAEMTNFEYAKQIFAQHGYTLPKVVFWNVEARNRQQPVTQNELGVALVSGCTPRIFDMLKSGVLNPYAFMLQVLGSERYRNIAA